MSSDAPEPTRKRSSEDRLRPHPAERFALPQHAFDLHETARELKAEQVAAPNKGHRQKTLYRHGKATVALFVFNAGAGLVEHQAAGTVTIHVIDGRMHIRAADSEHVFGPGGLLILAPNVEHDVHAIEDSIMLLQVHLE